MSPAPIPVPKVRKTMFRVPSPAPSRHSASAHALASFWRNAGHPSDRSQLRDDRHLVPAREGLAGTGGRPPGCPAGRRSSHPTAAGGGTRSCLIQERPSFAGRPRSSVACQERDRGSVEKLLRPMMRSPRGSAIPATTAVFVPPISTPMSTRDAAAMSAECSTAPGAANNRRLGHRIEKLHFCRLVSPHSTFMYATDRLKRIPRFGANLYDARIYVISARHGMVLVVTTVGSNILNPSCGVRPKPRRGHKTARRNT